MFRFACLTVMLASTACIEEHPDWLGAGGATSSSSTLETTSAGTPTSSDHATNTTGGASSGTSTTSGSATASPSGTSSTTSDGTATGATSTGSSTVTPGTGSGAVARRIFATSTIQTGNLGGRSGADLRCRDRADAAGLTGVWRALISTPAQSAADALALAGPLENMAGEVMATDGADLWDGALAAPVGFDESGASAGGRAWTGTAADGSATVDVCEDWSTQVGGFKATLGVASSVDATWIESAQTGACSQSYRLYCVSD